MEQIMTLFYLLIGIIVSFYFHKDYIIGEKEGEIEEPTLMIGMATIMVFWPIYVIYKAIKKFYPKK